MTDSSNTPTSTGGRPSLIFAEVARAPPSGATDQTSAPQFSFGRLSQSQIDTTKSGFSTPERPKSVQTEARTPTSSSTFHQSSQHFRYGSNTAPPPLQTRNRKDPAEGKIEAQAARIKALEAGFDVLTERNEKASGLVEKYEALLKTINKEYADKLKSSDDNSKMVLDRLVGSHVAQIMALEDEKETLNKRLMDSHKKTSILQETIEKQATTISSLTRAKANLGKELESGLVMINSLEEKNDNLAASDQKWNELVDTIRNDYKELGVKNSALEKQNKEYIGVIRALNETRSNLESELMGSFEILESLEETETGSEKKDIKNASVNPWRKFFKEGFESSVANDSSGKVKQLELATLTLSSPEMESSKMEKVYGGNSKAKNLLSQSLQTLSLFLIIIIFISVFAFWLISQQSWRI